MPQHPPYAPDARLCPHYMVGRCHDRSCKLLHDAHACKLNWEGHCPYGDAKCRNKHEIPAANKLDRVQAVEAAHVREREKREAFERALKEKGINPNTPEAARMLARPDATGPGGASSSPPGGKDGAAPATGGDTLPPQHMAVRARGTFNSDRHAPDVRLVVDPSPHRLTQELQVRDLGYFPCIFTRPGDEHIYEQLVDELSAVAMENKSALLRPWHGDTHWVADDACGWKERSPTYQMVVQRVSDYLGLTVNSTRLNWYKDGTEFKPFHHDAAAMSEEKAAVQNISVGISFGATRELALEESEAKRVITIPLHDGTVYSIGRDANVLWRHGILRTREALEEGRISIVLWGHRTQQETIAPPARLRSFPGGPPTGPHASSAAQPALRDSRPRGIDGE